LLSVCRPKVAGCVGIPPAQDDTAFVIRPTSSQSCRHPDRGTSPVRPPKSFAAPLTSCLARRRCRYRFQVQRIEESPATGLALSE